MQRPVNIIEVESLEDARIEPFVGLTDSQLRNRIEPEKGIFIAESAKVISRALEAGYHPLAFLMEHKWLESMGSVLENAIALDEDVPVFTAPRETLMQITGYDVTRGALAAFRRKPLPSVADLLSPESADRRPRRVAVLEDITNASNVGSIFRCAAALGIDAVLVTPGCCDPLYRRSIRVSMGAVFKIPWTYIGAEVEGRHAHGNVARSGGWATVGMPLLHDLGFDVVSLALSDDAVPIDDPILKGTGKLAVILGTEGEGLSERTIAMSDHVAMIRMSHGVDSLNVSVASAIAFWELCN